jgi:hypothetical protein
MSANGYPERARRGSKRAAEDAEFVISSGDDDEDDEDARSGHSGGGSDTSDQSLSPVTAALVERAARSAAKAAAPPKQPKRKPAAKAAAPGDERAVVTQCFVEVAAMTTEAQMRWHRGRFPVVPEAGMMEKLKEKLYKTAEYNNYDKSVLLIKVMRV